ncbi:MAG: 30S ribosomal protein S6 [Planctomycetes bacterium]|nr:30S ribosomal protein S6 [Planctomycetota bacterium]
MLVVDPVKGSSNWQDTVSEIQKIFDKSEAEVIEIKKFSDRKLAYPIKKNLVKYDRGCYVLSYFKTLPSKISKLKRDISLSDTILRCLILKLEGEPKAIEIPPMEKAKEMN